MATATPPKVRTRREARANRRVLPPDPARRAAPVDGLVLDGRRIDMQIGDRLLDATLDRTIEGPNTVTLTLWNRDRAVLRSGVFGQRVMSQAARVELDGLGFIATGVSKQGDNLDVTFEDEVVAALKRHGKGKPVRRSRGQVTRAHFCADLIRQAGVPVVVLDENVVQSIGGAKKLKQELRKARGDVPTTSSSGGRSSKKGVKGNGLTVKGAPATSEQRRNIATALGEANKLHASDRVKLTMLVSGIAENLWKSGLNSIGARGPFQVTPDTARSLHINAADLATVANIYLTRGFRGPGLGAIRLARAHPDWTPGYIADQIEGGGAGEHFYQQWISEAQEWLAAESGGSIGFDTSGTSASVHAWVKRYFFERRKNESTWACCYRLLVTEVEWRLFVREGVVIIASDPALMRATPALQISERSDAVETLDFDLHRALKVGEMTGQAYIGRWQADPGEPLEVDGLPQDSRNWLLATVHESLLGTTVLADLTLRAPHKPKPEPSSTIGTRTAITTSSDASGLYDACQQIDKQNLPYIWGGGHAHAGTPDSGTPGTGHDSAHANPNAPGYDCSGSVGAALAAAGLGIKVGDAVPGSGWFAQNWGKPGRGKNFTVWANAGHIFIELHFPGQPGKSFDTRRIGDSRSGPHLRTALGPTGGFVARHWPGEKAISDSQGGGIPLADQNPGRPGNNHPTG